MSNVIYSVDDKLSLKIGDIEIKVSPLQLSEKLDLQREMLLANGGSLEAAMKASAKAIKYGVKGIKGLQDRNGYAYTLEFEKENPRHLTDKCVDDLLNLEQNSKIVSICSQLIHGMSSAIIRDPFTNEPLEGVSFVEEKTEGK